ncbi:MULTISPECIES: type III pantothenate kinase [Myroides]|uniref:Type III pantothenate kinase n=1 Tax=Myroides albus TaxID=2562892 RepID=A0A6I3LGY5_9FLAO|nr:MULTISPECIES: type III pantothenate kinase [Myroides]MTG97097.1 type III pantothenate kinase [Myroides albus]MVX36814.1 type III pantothenate kinase [Myroides sp. LoEW2-1]UVD78480.1 type III pantothenate kinase [Myroides albus]
MILTIDIGNTRTKIAHFENNRLENLFTFEGENFLVFFQKKFTHLPKNTPTILSSVGKLATGELDWLRQNTNLMVINHQSPLPFINNYTTPNTLGIDRIVLSAGASLLYPNQDKLVIDIGTCITYDFINHKNEYTGGAISPGFSLRYKSLNDYTAKLPLLKLEDIDYLIGDSTNKAIHSGVINGIVSEIDGIINQYKELYPSLTIILTGGDTLFLAKRLKNIIFANSNFLLESLNALYQYIIENDKKNSIRL